MLEVSRRSEAYWRVVIRHPPLNLLDSRLMAELGSLMDRMEASRELTVVVFESGLPDYFMAHQDFLAAAEPSLRGDSHRFAWTDFTRRLELAPFASIGLIRGRARGAGSEFLLAMDMRFASVERTLLGHPEVGLGLLPGGGAMERLPALMGRARALEAILGCEDYSAQTAERFGWINQCVPDDELDGFVDRFACRLVRFGRQAVERTKKLQNLRCGSTPSEQLQHSEFVLSGLMSDPATIALLRQYQERGLQSDSQFERNLGSLLGLQ